MKTLKLWWKWRKSKRKQYPLRYIGPTLTLRGEPLEYGTPLKAVQGRKGSYGGQQYIAPDFVVRVINRNQVEAR